jgi:hypothetical protein
MQVHESRRPAHAVAILRLVVSELVQERGIARGAAELHFSEIVVCSPEDTTRPGVLRVPMQCHIEIICTLCLQNLFAPTRQGVPPAQDVIRHANRDIDVHLATFPPQTH